MFKKVLIANRGEIALRVIQTCRRLGIQTVAVYSDADQTALHVQAADEAVHIGKSRAQGSYLSVDALLGAIRATGADAVHPGYGLLSEDPGFAAAVRGLGVSFIGPSEEALTQFGDKLKARAFASGLGVQSAPGTRSPVTTDDAAALRVTADAIGYPLLVKAAAGGGGIGMQPAFAGDELEQAVATCTARSQAAFGDGRVYLERYFSAPRHIEVQVLADAHGNALALGERECSVQRRHQKILEESPSPASAFYGEAGALLRTKLHQQAITLLRGMDYQGLGTVEFLADFSGASPELYFLEVNARIQVEHPVTERVYGVDLVEAQLAVSAGEPIPRAVLDAKPEGHSVEVRLYAEDPQKKFIPQPGRLERLEWPAGATLGAGDGQRTQLRIDSGYASGDEVTPYYDPMIAKIISWGESRSAAIRILADGLQRTHVSLQGPKGPKQTNLDFLRTLLGDIRLLQGDYDTQLVSHLMS